MLWCQKYGIYASRPWKIPTNPFFLICISRFIMTEKRAIISCNCLWKTEGDKTVLRLADLVFISLSTWTAYHSTRPKLFSNIFSILGWLRIAKAAVEKKLLWENVWKEFRSANICFVIKGIDSIIPSWAC